MAADRYHAVNKGTVLVGVLWLTGILMALLAVAAQSSRLDGRVSLSALEKIRCRWLCRAGAETALAILKQDLKDTDSLLDDWANNPDELTQVPMEGGTFTITITDECSKLNLNLAKATQLMGLTTEGMDETLSDSIQDWRDADEEARTSGAENGYYANLNYGYLCRNAWFRSPREVLRVRGMTDELFYGQNNRSLGQGGLSRFLTCHSAVINKDASGNAKVDVNRASESELTSKLSLSSEQAKWVVQNRPFRSLGDLVTARNTSSSPASGGSGGGTGSSRSTGSGGSPQSGRPSSLLDTDRLLPLAGGYRDLQFSPTLATRPALLAADAGGGGQGGSGEGRGGRGGTGGGRGGSGGRGGTGGGQGGQDGGGRPGGTDGGGRGGSGESGEGGGGPGGGRGGQTGRPGGQGSQGGSPAGGGSAETTAQPLDWATLSRIADQITLRSDEYLYGMMNVNTATAEALTAFFDGDINLAAKVIEFRESQGGVITSVFDLASVEGMGQDTLKKYIDRLSVRSSIFFVRVVARSAACGLEYYLEMVVNRDRTGNEMLYRLEGIGH